MKLLSLLVLPLFAALSPMLSAQRPHDTLERYVAAIESETQAGLDDLDAAFAVAERRLIAMIASGARSPVMREHLLRTQEGFQNMVLHRVRTVRGLEAEALDFLMKRGADRNLIQRIRRLADDQIGLLERHQVQLMNRLRSILDRMTA